MSTTTLSFVLALSIALSASAQHQAQPIRAVIITGVDWKGHIWRETAPAVRDILQADPRFQVKIVEDPGFLANEGLFQFDLLVLMFKNYEPIPQEEKAKNNLLRFVGDGNGLAVIHFASGAFEGWPEFRNLVGRAQQKRHDKRGPFTVAITNPTHPVTRGMKDFETDDELFIDLQGERPIEVLASARSNITGKDHPMAFVLEHGKGRVFHTTLGHDEKALRLPGPSGLIRRGAAWAAGREPAMSPAAGAAGSVDADEAAIEQHRKGNLRMEAILMWGFWEGANWLPASSLFALDWTPKPAAKAYKDLVYGTWWTRAKGVTDARGDYEARDFFGQHRVRVGERTFEVELTKAKGELVLDAR